MEDDIRSAVVTFNLSGYRRTRRNNTVNPVVVKEVESRKKQWTSHQRISQFSRPGDDVHGRKTIIFSL